MTAVFPHKNNTSMNKSNTLYWKTATDPAERIEVRLVLNSYIDNDNLYVGLESRSKENPECWESYTDITVNLNSLPPFHAYVDNRDCNRHVHDFLTHGICYLFNTRRSYFLIIYRIRQLFYQIPKCAVSLAVLQVIKLEWCCHPAVI